MAQLLEASFLSGDAKPLRTVHGDHYRPVGTGYG
jgi:hypothetical protein